MFLLILILLVFSVWAWFHIKFGHRSALLAKIPSPKKLPLIHHATMFIGKSPRELFIMMEEIRRELGPVFHFSFYPYDGSTVLIADPKTAEGILSSQKLIEKSVDYDMIKPWLGTGLLIASGKKWHQRRKIITPAFHFQILERFVETMDEQGMVLIEKLTKLDGQEVDIFPLVNLYALDVICGW